MPEPNPAGNPLCVSRPYASSNRRASESSTTAPAMSPYSVGVARLNGNASDGGGVQEAVRSSKTRGTPAWMRQKSSLRASQPCSATARKASGVLHRVRHPHVPLEVDAGGSGPRMEIQSPSVFGVRHGLFCSRRRPCPNHYGGDAVAEHVPAPGTLPPEHEPWIPLGGRHCGPLLRDGATPRSRGWTTCRSRTPVFSISPSAGSRAG